MAATGVWVAFAETKSAEGKDVEVVQAVFSSELTALRFAIAGSFKAGFAPFGADLAADHIAPLAPGPVRATKPELAAHRAARAPEVKS